MTAAHALPKLPDLPELKDSSGSGRVADMETLVIRPIN
jgi:hypothetical protein